MTGSKPLKPPSMKGLDFALGEVAELRLHNSLVDEGKKQGNHRLLTISPSVSNLCNLACIYCYTDGGASKPNELNLEELKSVVRQGKELGARTVLFAGAGEPLCDRNFLPLLEYINSLGMATIFYTNATLVTAELARKLYSLNVSVIAKFNSISPKTQDELVGVKGASKLIRKGLLNLAKAGFNKTTPTRLGVETVVCKQNIKELPRMWRWARKSNIYPHFETLLHCGRAVENSKRLGVTLRQLKQVFNDISEIDRKEFGYSWFPHPPYMASDCDMLYKNIVVDADGEIRPCYGFIESVGNIRNISLKDALKTDMMKKTRNIDTLIEGKCAKCSIKHSCYGCRTEMSVCQKTFESYASCWIKPKRR